MAKKPSRGAEVAGALLRDLLASDPRYRRLWRRRVARDHRDDVSQSAVAKVIEEHLWDSGERSEDMANLARQLKDRISRAFKGDRLSAETLTWFMEAFQMSETDENRLWAAFAQQGNDLGVSNTLHQRREMVRRQCHRTVSLIERYSVDRHGSLAERRTHHTIRAIEDGVDIYIFNHEPQASRIEVVHGGVVGHSYMYGGGLTSVEIILSRPLGKGESTVLEYRTCFDTQLTQLTEVRRAAFARSENVDFAVKFDNSKIPRHVWWCAWDDHFNGNRVVETPIAIRNETVRKFLPYIEEAVVGFRWDW